MRGLGRIAMLAALLTAAHVAAGCNAVLGIEQAELDTTTSQQPLTCSWPPPDPTVACPVGCDDDCQTHCNVPACLGNKDCRTAIKDSLKCAGNACIDTNGKCDGCVARNSAAVQVAECLKRDRRLPITAAASLCDAYCACMHDRCPADEPNTADNACQDICEKGLANPTPDADPFGFWGRGTAPLPAEIFCLWSHCEMAPRVDDGFHCLHAVGKDAASKCPGTPPPPDPHAIACEYPKGYGNAPCNDDADCCATCRDHTVCASP